MKSPFASRFGLAAAALLLLGLVAAAKIPGLSVLATFLLTTAGIIGLGWLLRKLYQLFMWRVGRRLFFSYFLIGVVPIPMLALMGIGSLQVAATVFLGHLYRDTLRSFEGDLTLRAQQALAIFAAQERPGAQRDGDFVLGYYEKGVRVGGSEELPAQWPRWLTEAPATGDGDAASSTRMLRSARYTRFPDGRISLALGIVEGSRAVMALYDGEAATELRTRGGFWVGMQPAHSDESSDSSSGDDPQASGETSGPRATSSPAAPEPTADPALERQRILDFLGARPGGSWLDQPSIRWRQSFGPLFPLGEGLVLRAGIDTDLCTTPRWMFRQVLLDASARSARLQVTFMLVMTLLLLLLYAAAVLVAGLMIWGLSSAVNRLSRATAAVQKGDFSVRIPVRRTDQLGVLQASFNTMAENLEGLVKTAAQKEILENELAIARELQQSLIPQDLPHGNGLEFATLFAPSAALGGDYFDILELAGDRLAIVIADVSGHGLSAGLRMAMIKAALLVLMEEERDPESVLGRLDALVRKRTGERFFVTATLAMLHRPSGRLELFNAGHPPTYLLRGAAVEEICLAGSPLGALGHHYGKATRQLEPGDTLVWLSDGFLEATNAQDEPLGYDGLTRALAGPWSTAVDVRAHLLATLERHAGDRPAEDDRSLVVLRWEPV